MRRTTTTAAAAVVLIPLLVCAAGSPALAADSGDVAVTNTETVQAKLSATGAFQEARVYDQLALSGNGTATISNPVSTKGLRNLDGFTGYKVVDGKLVSTLTVDGERRERTVSTYDKDLPLTVQVTYTLDGKPVQPGAVVGKSGTLGVHYKVTNVTGKTQDVTYDDGTGATATASAETVVPMIGQLVTVLPSSFTDVQSDEAGMAGDGRGGTRMQFQMTLFPPIGSATAEFGYTAKVSHAVVPKANLTSMPVSPLDYPSFKGGAESYKAGAQKGVDLTSGALQIDDSVLQLHDGAAQLLAGLLQLRDGAATLSAGLNDSAAPGAAELADGLTDEAAPGAARLAAGAGQLDAGLAEARSKAPQLLGGLSQVDSGLALVDAGLAKIYGDIGTLPEQAQPLHDGIVKLREGIGTTTTEGTLLQGVDQLRQQVGTNAPFLLDKLADGVYSNDASSPGAYQQLSCAIVILTDVKNGATAVPAGGHPCYAPGPRPAMTGLAITDPTAAAVVSGLITKLSAGQARLADPAHLGDATDDDFYGGDLSTSANLQQGLTYLQGRLANLAGPGLARIECGISSAALPGCDPAAPGVLQALTSSKEAGDSFDGIDAGVTALVNGVVGKVRKGVGDDDDTKADGTLRGGVHSLQAGTDQLSAGGDTLASGLAQLGAGASRLNDGAGDLSAGIAKAAAGSRALSDGLNDAADGSAQLSDGLNTAAEGAPKLVDGTQQLSDEGTSQVVVSGQATAEDFGVKYAVLSAGAERASTEGMAYGAPQGAVGATAYSIDIAGADGTGVSSLGRFIAAIVLFAAGIGLATFARRRFV
ncbi:MAG: hypothetical protein ABWY33_09090 [Cellulomonas sp.]